MKPSPPPHRLRVLAPEQPEFAVGVDEPPNELDRREMMKLLAAGAALAAAPLSGCMEPPKERIMPRVEQPPELTPGVPVEYATAMVIDGIATGLVVKTYEARPTKVEGNPDHPTSLGATNAYHQASILDLYDPNRAKGPLELGRPLALDQVVRGIAERERIPGLWFLMHPQSSPLVEDLIARVRARHPGARFAFYSPAERREVHEGARLAFGQPLDAQYRLADTDVVVALDADFMAAMPASVRWARDFAQRRRPQWPLTDIARLHAAEPRPTPTGSLADHRLPARASEIGPLAAALLAMVRGDRTAAAALPARHRRWVERAAADLAAHRGRALVIVGDRQPAAVHLLGNAINEAIGAIGSTVVFTRPAIIEPLGDGISELAAAIHAGQVRTLVIAEANPVYSATELALDVLLSLVPDTIYAGLGPNETSQRCRRFVPLAHYMEAWGDARAHDGTISLVQPLLRPMYESIGLAELLAAFTGDPTPSAHDMLRERYARGGDGELVWMRALKLGLLAGTSFQPVTAGVDPSRTAARASAPIAPATNQLELAFELSPAVFDGRFAGISWLQELPKPLDKITWGNAALLAPATARELGVETEDVLRVQVGERRAELPVYVLPGHAEGCVTVELGYGRWSAGPVAEGVGVDLYRLRPARVPYAIAVIERTGERQPIARTQTHFDQDGREIAPATTLAHYRAEPQFTEHLWGPLPSALPEQFEGMPSWGMTIDTSICTGCSACVIACQAENNIPVVGKSGVIANREMHWLRIDMYREERGEDVEVVHQPMLCQHCEDAPCEYVCPVYATQHSPDGLNEMIYNRCIGTRFCSNNCPYKVRRFNWFDYTEATPKTVQLQHNPNVTVRARGVMEKCTYCVQRIRGAEIDARRQNREIRPGEVVTACQQACPTRAITFGLLNHGETDVVRLRQQPRHYAVLHELGTRPRTVYLAKITNPTSGDKS